MKLISSLLGYLVLALSMAADADIRLNPRTGGMTGWRCLTSPTNNNHSLWVTALGPNLTEISCHGSTHDSCFWFGDPHCTQPISGTEGNVGRICCCGRTQQGGWCDEAKTLLSNNSDHRFQTLTVTKTKTLRCVTETVTKTETATVTST